MSLLEKLKNLHCGPPPPPRRPDDNADFGWPQDEFDDEDNDMYEVPPCDPEVKIPQRQAEENLYLDTTSNPTPPTRSNPPKPQQRNNFSFEPITKKPPEFDRNEKPGRKKVPPPASLEEDVYLDPNEDQEMTDDVYVEPTEACTPPPLSAQLRKHTAVVPPPKPMVKPPVPRASSNLVLPSMNEFKTVGERRASFPAKLPPPSPTERQFLPANQRIAKLGPPKPPPADTKPVAFFGGKRTTKQCRNEDKEWFAGSCNRQAAEDLLLKLNQDGAFLIRNSSAQSPRQPYTLAVLYKQKVYNIPIRFLEDTGYALGKEGKKSEEIFASLEDMISYHKNNQLLLIDSKSQAKHTAHLTHPARP